jgi:hypothetical protein
MKSRGFVGPMKENLGVNGWFWKMLGRNFWSTSERNIAWKDSVAFFGICRSTIAGCFGDSGSGNESLESHE